MVVANIAMGIALILAVSNRSLGIFDIYRQVWPFFWRYLGLSILIGLTIVVGLIMLVIPGIVFAIWLCFATFVLVLENGQIVDSMKRSREYVRGRFFEVALRLVVIGLVAIVVMVAFTGVATLIGSTLTTNGEMAANIGSSLISLVLSPVTLAYVYLMYQDIKSGEVAVV